MKNLYLYSNNSRYMAYNGKDSTRMFTRLIDVLASQKAALAMFQKNGGIKKPYARQG
jgi:hypothetical protein